MTGFYLIIFLVDVALGTIFLAVPLYAIHKFNASSMYLGILGAVGAVFYAASCLVTGHFADRLSKKMLAVISCLIYSVLYLFFIPNIKNLNQLLFIYPMGSIAMALFWPSIQSWIAHGLDKRKLMKALGFFNLSWSAGLIAGPFVGGWIFQIYGAKAFMFAGSLVFICAVSLIFMPSRHGCLPAETSLSENEKTDNRFIYISWIANFASFFCIGIIRGLFPKLAVLVNITPGVLGFITCLVGLTQLAMFLMLMRAHNWHYKIKTLIIFQVIGVIGMAMLFAGASAAIFGIGLFLLGLTFGITYYSSIFYSLFKQKDKGRKSGFHEAIIGSGALFGPLIGGLAAQNINIRAPYLICGSLIIAAILVELKILNNNVKH